MEVNYANLGWEEVIETSSDTYSRDMHYIQVPILARMGWGYEEKGAMFYVVAGPQLCDYPVYARKVAEAILSGECEEGILLCGTGIGMSMAANKIKGIRAALCSDCFSAQATKEHNNANVLCMGARVIGPELAFRIADTFLDSKFSNDERHIRRISMLED